MFTGVGEGRSENEEQFHLESENVAKQLVGEQDKSSKAKSELKKTWGFRRSTIAKREMPVEAVTDSPETRCPVRRSGRQPKRTDKLEEFLLNAKRASRKSAPPSVESGDPPSQTPTDAETASEASFDGNADSKAVEEKAETPERRTRSGARKQTQKKGRGGGRQTRGGGATVKDEGSSENEEDSKDAVKNAQDNSEEKKEEKSDPTSEAVGSVSAAQTQPEEDSEKTEFAEEKNDDKNDELEKTGEDEADKAAAVQGKRGPIRTYVNKKKAANKNITPVKAADNKNNALVKKEAKPKATQSGVKTRKPQTQEEEEEGEEEEEEDEDEEDDDEDDEDENDLSTSSSSVESDDGGYDPNALYCICRQKHNKRFVLASLYHVVHKLVFVSLYCLLVASVGIISYTRKKKMF